MEFMFDQGLARLAPQLVLLGLGGVIGLWVFRSIKLPGWVGAVLVGMLLSASIMGQYAEKQYANIFLGGQQKAQELERGAARFKQLKADFDKVTEEQLTQYKAMGITEGAAADALIVERKAQWAKIQAQYDHASSKLAQRMIGEQQSLQRFHDEAVTAMLLLTLIVVGWQCRPWNYMKNRMESLTLGIGMFIVIMLVSLAVSWFLLPLLVEDVSAWQKVGVFLGLSLVAMIPVNSDLKFLRESKKDQTDRPDASNTGDLSHAIYAATWFYQCVWWCVLAVVIAIFALRPVGAMSQVLETAQGAGTWVLFILQAGGLALGYMLTVGLVALVVYWLRSWGRVDTQRVLMCIALTLFTLVAFFGYQLNMDMEIMIILGMLAAGAIYLLPDRNHRARAIQMTELDKQEKESLTWVDFPMAFALAGVGQSMLLLYPGKIAVQTLILIVLIVVIRVVLGLFMSKVLLNRSAGIGMGLGTIWLRSGATGVMALWLLREVIADHVLNSLIIAWMVIAILRVPLAMIMKKNKASSASGDEGDDMFVHEDHKFTGSIG